MHFMGFPSRTGGLNFDFISPYLITAERVSERNYFRANGKIRNYFRTNRERRNKFHPIGKYG
jgi:hypothetical protein